MVRLQSSVTQSKPTQTPLSRLRQPRTHIPFKYSCSPTSPADVKCELAAYSTVAWFLWFRVVYDGLYDGLCGGLCDGPFNNLPILADVRLVSFFGAVASF